jgi:hypothetical protein
MPNSSDAVAWRQHKSKSLKSSASHASLVRIPSSTGRGFHVCQCVRAFFDTEGRFIEQLPGELIEQHLIYRGAKFSESLHKLRIPLQERIGNGRGALFKVLPRQFHIEISSRIFGRARVGQALLAACLPKASS